MLNAISNLCIDQVGCLYDSSVWAIKKEVHSEEIDQLEKGLHPEHNKSVYFVNKSWGLEFVHVEINVVNTHTLLAVLCTDCIAWGSDDTSESDRKLSI